MTRLFTIVRACVFVRACVCVCVSVCVCPQVSYVQLYKEQVFDLLNPAGVGFAPVTSQQSRNTPNQGARSRPSTRTHTHTHARTTRPVTRLRLHDSPTNKNPRKWYARSSVRLVHTTHVCAWECVRVCVCTTGGAWGAARSAPLPGKPLHMRWSKSQEFYLENLFKVRVDTHTHTHAHTRARTLTHTYTPSYLPCVRMLAH